MEQQELIDFYQKAKQIGIALCDWNNPERYFDGIMVDEKGDVEVKFSHYSRGETDYDTVYLTFDDINDSPETIIEKYKKIAADARETARVKAEEDAKKQKEEALKAQEQRDIAEYQRLKNKFETKT